MQISFMETFETSSDRENERQRRPKVFACIPAYNQDKSIERVVRATLKYVEHVIVIDDGSFDRTAELAEQAGALVIRHAMNMGYGATIKSGFRMALKERADIIVTLDADLQHSPEDIPSLLAPILNGDAEIVIGSRMDEKDSQMPSYRKMGVYFITKLLQFNGVPVKDAQSGFRAYSAKALRIILPNLTHSGFGLITESLAEASRFGLPIAEVPVLIKYNTGFKTSTKNPVLHGAGVLYSIVYYVAERRPLLTVGFPGIIFFALGVAGLINVLEIFNRSQQFAIGTGIFTIGAIVLGVLLIFVAVILTVLARLSKRISDLKQSELY